MHCIVHGVANSRTRLSDFHFILTPGGGGLMCVSLLFVLKY